MRTHVTILGWLQILMGVIDLLLALLIFGFFAGIGAIAGLGGEAGGALVGGLLATLLGTVVALTALPNLLAGWGLLRHRSWGRILALVVAVVNGLKFPWGTAFAIYTLWVLMDDRTKALFDR